MNKDVMNEGVQILLDRMDTNPEEFDDYAGKWGDIIGAVHARKNLPPNVKLVDNHPLPFLTDPEVNALYDKLEDVRRENFTSDVLRRLANTPKEIAQQELWDTSYSSSNLPHIGTPMTTKTVTLSEIERLTERDKDKILDALDSYNKIEKKNRKLVK
jgi:hypothetical protein